MQKILNSSVLKRGGSSSLSLACAIQQIKALLGPPGICGPHPAVVYRSPVGSTSLRRSAERTWPRAMLGGRWSSPNIV